MRRKAHTASGQSSVEFTLLLGVLVLFLFLPLQLSLIAIQKWYFNFTSLYAARVWSVQHGMSPQAALSGSQGLAWVHHPNLNTSFLALFMAAEQFEDGLDGRPPGIRYEAIATVLPLYRPYLGLRTGSTTLLTGAAHFRTYIPMDKEETLAGAQDPARWDNDCSTPCDDNER